MKIHYVIGPLVLALALLAGPVFGELQLVDNFDHYETGQFSNVWDPGPNGELGGTWTPSTGTVQIENRDGSHVMRVSNLSGGGPRVSMIYGLNDPIAEQNTGILFFRFKMAESYRADARAFLGLHNWDSAMYDPLDIIAGFGVVGPPEGPHDLVTVDEQVISEGLLESEQWHNVWIVADMVTHTFDLYISEAPGPAGPAAMPQIEDLQAVGLPFTSDPEGPLDGAMFLQAEYPEPELTMRLWVDEVHWLAQYWPDMPGVTNWVPDHRQQLVELDQVLSWDAPVMQDPNIVEIFGYDIYLDTDEALVDAGDVSAQVAELHPDTTYEPADLLPDETYYWRVDAHYLLDDPNETEVFQPGRTLSFSTIMSIPLVTEQPVDVVAGLGQSAEYFVAVESIFPVQSYQWYRYVDGENDIALVDGADISGAQTDTLVISDIKLEDFGYYYCQVTNEIGPVYSEAAILERARVLGHWTLSMADFDAENSLHLDISGEGNHAESTLEPVFTDGAAGDSDTAVLMGSDEAFVKAGRWDPSEYAEMFSVTAWVKFNEMDYQHLIASKRDGWAAEVNRWGFRVHPDTNRLSLWNPGGSSESDLELSADEWYHVVCTFDNGTVRFYVNGAEAGGDDGHDLAFGTDATVNIGSSNGTSNPVEGAMDDVRIFNYPVSHREVAEMYSAVTGAIICVDQSPFDLTGDCKVGIADFALFASEWLECGLSPQTACP